MKKLLGLGSRNKKRPGAIGIDINIGPDDNPSNSMRGQAIKAPGAAHKKEQGRAGGSAAEIESLGVELVESKRRAISWDQYDAAYEVWKRYKKQNIDRHEALQIIGDKYGVRAFFLLYPLYKIVRPFLKLKRSLENKISARKIIIGSRSIFDSSKKSILLISHDASQTGAPILAFNLMEKFAARYNVISVLLGPGKLKNAFTNLSFATIGPFEPGRG